MKQRASESGAQEAIIVRDGEVLEGSSTSVLIVRDGVLITPPNSHRILPGTTRDVALELARRTMPTEIRSVSVSELYAADEVWIAAATRDVLPISTIDSRPIGSGRPGPFWQNNSEAFLKLRSELSGSPAYDHTSEG
jgi:D-alanine transaminase